MLLQDSEGWHKLEGFGRRKGGREEKRRGRGKNKEGSRASSSHLSLGFHQFIVVLHHLPLVHISLTVFASPVNLLTIRDSLWQCLLVVMVLTGISAGISIEQLGKTKSI